MARCQGTKQDGSPCTVMVLGSNTYCWHHDPANAAKRKRTARKAGKSKPSRELQEVKGQLQRLVDRIDEGTIERADAAVMGQLLNYLVRTVQVEIQVRESQELEERIEAIEEALAEQQTHHTPGSRYGSKPRPVES
jgi:hypothetical protein